MKRAFIAGILLLTGGLASVAQASTAPQTSLRPVARVQIGVAVPANAMAFVRPVARTDALTRKILSDVLKRPVAQPDPILLQASAVLATASGLATSRRPVARPGIVAERAMSRRLERRRGSVCGDIDLQGEEVGFVPGKLKGCGIPDAVRLTSVDGVRLSQPALMRCESARALKTWVKKGAKRAIGNRGGGLVEMRVAAHYACRTRNHQPGAPLSEHSTGRAIDLSEFKLKNGSSLSVLNDWGKGRDGRILKKMHKAACGPFGTVLGPESDRFHRDHFHFDTARHGGGPYCR